MPVIITNGFDGEKFAAKYGLGMYDFSVQNGRELVCKLLPNLTQEDIVDCSITLIDIQENAISEINRQAEEERMKYLTFGYAQAMVYSDKQDELLRYGESSSDSFPYAERRAVRRGISVSDVMDEWSKMESQTRYMLMVSEDIREAGKDAVVLAESEDEINTILSNLQWVE